MPRTIWGALLYGAGVGLARPAPFIHESFAWSAATGQWPDGGALGVADPTGTVPDTDAVYHAHSPLAFVEEGHLLDLPVIWGQGITDQLFPLNEGLANFERTFTPGAREHSVFVGYNSGHVLPTVYPLTSPGSGDACSFDGFGDLRLEFFQAVAAGAEDPSAVLRAAHPDLARYNLTTEDGACVRMEALPEPTAAATGTDVDLVVTQFNDAWMTGSGAGPAVPLAIPGMVGPLTIAGIPRLRGSVATAGVDQRAFFGLAVGTDVASAQLLNGNLQPLRVATPSTNITAPFDIELPGVAVELAPGEQLFLTVAPTSDQFLGHGSRAPGWMGFVDLEVALPIVR